MDNLQGIIEGILFVSGDGIDKGELIEKLGVLPDELTEILKNIEKKFNQKNSGINYIEYNNKIQLCSNPKYADDISNVLNPIREKQLTKTTLETMAIIAYKQPVTRLEIEEIRGVNSDYAIQTLLGFKLIEVVGRKDAIGKPLLFGTTDDFLKRFQLKSLAELPEYEELINRIKIMEKPVENDNELYNYTDYENKQEKTEIANVSLETEIVNEEVEKQNDLPQQIYNEETLTQTEPKAEIEQTIFVEEAKEVVEKTMDSNVVEQISLKPKRHKKRDENSLFEIGGEPENFEKQIDDDIPDFLKDEKEIQIIE